MWADWVRPDETVRFPTNGRKTALILWRRDGNICQICGLTVDIALRNRHPGMASIDHVDPVRRYAGAYDKSVIDVWGNIRLAHLYCNTAHGDFDPRFIAVENYRRMLRAAIGMHDVGLPVGPPRTFGILRTEPLVTPEWIIEQETGRPTGGFGEEWKLPGGIGDPRSEDRYSRSQASTVATSAGVRPTAGSGATNVS